jgi:3-deoxy-D-manno-octulosonic-acid transferase
MENFREMADQFLDAHAGVQVANGEQLGRVWVLLIQNNEMREGMGTAARQISERNRGATARSLERIVSLIGQREGQIQGEATDGGSATDGPQKGSAA